MTVTTSACLRVRALPWRTRWGGGRRTRRILSRAATDEGRGCVGRVLVEHAYQDMLELWLAFFDGGAQARAAQAAAQAARAGRPRARDAPAGAEDHGVRPVLVLLYDGLVAALMRLTDNLDLGVHALDGDVVSSDSARSGSSTEAGPAAVAAGARLAAGRPKDFAIFLNMVAFTEALLPALPSSLFARWVRWTCTLCGCLPPSPSLCALTLCVGQAYPYGRHVVEASAAHPLVSGFYKLAALTLSLADSARVFAPAAAAAAETSAPAAEGRSALVAMFRAYLHTTLARMQAFKDDLLVRRRFPPR
jgi:hypothetical protein